MAATPWDVVGRIATEAFRPALFHKSGWVAKEGIVMTQVAFGARQAHRPAFAPLPAAFLDTVDHSGLRCRCGGLRRSDVVAVLGRALRPRCRHHGRPASC